MEGGAELIVQERSFLEALNTFIVIGIGSVIGLKEKVNRRVCFLSTLK